MICHRPAGGRSNHLRIELLPCSLRVALGGSASTGGIAGEYPLTDVGMLAPNDLAKIALYERHAHAALEMRPPLRNRIGDRRVAGKRIDRGVKGDVELDPFVGAGIIGGAAAGSET